MVGILSRACVLLFIGLLYFDDDDDDDDDYYRQPAAAYTSDSF